MRALDVGGYEYGDYQHQNHQTIYGVSVCFDEPPVDEQDREPDNQRKPDPKELFSRKLREVEHARMVEVVACSIDADGSGYHENEVCEDGNPVDITKR